MIHTAPRVLVDLEHGGRWTSLCVGGREWLWRRPGVGRPAVEPGAEFVDAGGLEECLPTVRGEPDHGQVWSRVWRSDHGWGVCECPDFELKRRVTVSGEGVLAEYELSAAAGFSFLWAAHALLDVSGAGRVELAGATEMRVYPGTGRGWVAERWPGAARLDRLGPDDGTAVGAVVPGVRRVRVSDGEELTMRIEGADGAPASVAIWRNLRGFGRPAPYRSIGVEPMLGAVFDRAEGGPGDLATVPAGGKLAWALRIEGA